MSTYSPQMKWNYWLFDPVMHVFVGDDVSRPIKKEKPHLQLLSPSAVRRASEIDDFDALLQLRSCKARRLLFRRRRRALEASAKGHRRIFFQICICITLRNILQTYLSKMDLSMNG